MTVFLKRHRRLVVVFAMIALAGLCGVLWFKHRYPFGYSHCCSKAMMFALEQYADDHEGRYPAGQPTPEASLSLLHDAPYDLGAETLRGKSVPVEVVESIFDKGEHLGPDSCGWHYVAGLTQNDDRGLAILWDKVGLGHFGERYIDGGREVVFVGGDIRVIPGAEWPAFLEEQKELMARRDELAIQGRPVLVAKIKMPTGEIVDQVDSPFSLQEEYVSATRTSKGTGTRSGSVLRPSLLKWRRKDFVPTGEVTKTLILSFPEKRMRSKPVTVKIENGRAIPDAILFEMEVIQ